MNPWANRVSVILTVGLVAAAAALGWALKPKPEASATRARDARAIHAEAASSRATPPVPAGPRHASAARARSVAEPPGPRTADPVAGRWLEAVSTAVAASARGASRALESASAGARVASAWVASVAPGALDAVASQATGAAAWAVAPLVMIAALALRGAVQRSRRRSRSRVLGLARRGGTAASIARRLAIPQDAVRALMRPDAPGRG